MRLTSSFLALALSTSAVFANDVRPLPAGAPAGVKHAQEIGHGTLVYVLLGAAVVAGIAIAASSGGNNAASPTPTPTTTTTSTTTT